VVATQVVNLLCQAPVVSSACLCIAIVVYFNTYVRQVVQEAIVNISITVIAIMAIIVVIRPSIYYPRLPTIALRPYSIICRVAFRRSARPEALCALASFIKVEHAIKIRQLVIREVAIKLVAS
jgi:hypothetical protein